MSIDQGIESVVTVTVDEEEIGTQKDIPSDIIHLSIDEQEEDVKEHDVDVLNGPNIMIIGFYMNLMRFIR